MKPQVSIVTPYRNARRFVALFVDALKRQTFQDWLCIMVDDGSSDGGPALLEDLVGHDSRFLLIGNTIPKHGPGPASARNCALPLVDSDLVAFCDIDDFWHPEKLQRQLAFHLSNRLDLSVTAYARFLEGQQARPPQCVVSPPAQLDLRDLLGRNPIPMLTVILSTELARAGFAQVAHEDFLFWLDLFKARSNLRYGCLPEVLAFYCVHPSSLSSRKIAMPFWAYRVFRNFGQSRVSSVIYLCFWLFDHFRDQLGLWKREFIIVDSIAELQERPPLRLSQGESSSS